MHENNNEEQMEVRARSALLHYYSSELTSHAPVILTIVVIMAAMFWGYFQVKNTIGLQKAIAIICAVSLSILSLILIRQTLRLIYWAKLTTSIILIPRITREDERRKQIGLMGSLHEHTFTHIKETYLSDLPGWFIRKFLVDPEFPWWKRWSCYLFYLLVTTMVLYLFFCKV